MAKNKKQTSDCGGKMRDCELFTICFTRGHLPWISRQCLFLSAVFVLASHTATFLAEPVARREVPGRLQP